MTAWLLNYVMKQSSIYYVHMWLFARAVCQLPGALFKVLFTFEVVSIIDSICAKFMPIYLSHVQRNEQDLQKYIS